MVRDRRSERGAAMIELALILPILVMLVFGIVEFGRGYHAKTTITHAAREAARVAALDIGDPVATAKNAAPSLDPNQITVAISASPCVPGSPVSVVVTYPVTYDIPLVGSGTWTISETGTMRCNG